MKNSFGAPVVPLTPESVLEILRDFHRQQGFHDPEVDPDIDLTFESTIDDWREACDWLDWKPLGRAMNERFGVNYSDHQWHEVLEPSDKNTLREVCKLIARQGERYSIKPLKILGGSCPEAGVFIALRAALKNAGVPVETIKPSSLLEPILIKHWGLISDEVGKIAPGVMPPVNIEVTLFQRMMFWAALSSLPLGLFDLIFGPSVVTLFALLMGCSCCLLMEVASRMGPKSVSLENLETFGDLCSRISESTLKDRPA